MTAGPAGASGRSACGGLLNGIAGLPEEPERLAGEAGAEEGDREAAAYLRTITAG